MVPAWVRAVWGRGLLAASSCGLVLALGCGGTIGGPDGSGGSGGDGLEDGSGGFSSGGTQPQESGGTGGVSTGGAGSGGTPYVEPDCPDEPPPPVEPECDPMAEETGCYEGYGCYPYLDYPSGERCGFASVGAVCLLAGTEDQGEICGTGTYCKPGFMCVIGGTAGARCAEICSTSDPASCPPGLVCNETDVIGFGVCF